MIYGSSPTDPRYANYKGSQTYAPVSRPGVNVPFIGTGKTATGATTGGGQVLGAQAPAPTPQPTNNDNGTQAATDEAARREQEVRSAINTGYDDYEGRLRGIETADNTSRDDELLSASKTYDTIFGGLNTQKQVNLDKLEANRGEVKTREARSIQDLKQNLGNVVRGTSMQLGAMGAGDTSAANVVMPYAYTKLAGTQEGTIRRQSNDQQFQIDQSEKDTELEFSKMWTQTETEKEAKLQDIKTYYGDRIRNVQLALASAPTERQQQLSNLSLGLLQEARAKLSAIEAEDRQRKSDIKVWATNRMSALDDMKLKLGGNANFNPRDITFQELKMMGGNEVASSGNDAFVNPMALAKQRRDEFFA